jgi:hypothetical protein
MAGFGISDAEPLVCIAKSLLRVSMFADDLVPKSLHTFRRYVTAYMFMITTKEENTNEHRKEGQTEINIEGKKEGETKKE